MQPESLSKAIQLSVAPVFLLAGIGALMNVLSGRLARIVDNAKQLRLTAMPEVTWMNWSDDWPGAACNW